VIVVLAMAMEMAMMRVNGAIIIRRITTTTALRTSIITTRIISTTVVIAMEMDTETLITIDL
jgi:hypothetical protein